MDIISQRPIGSHLPKADLFNLWAPLSISNFLPSSPRFACAPRTVARCRTRTCTEESGFTDTNSSSLRWCKRSAPNQSLKKSAKPSFEAWPSENADPRIDPKRKTSAGSGTRWEVGLLSILPLQGGWSHMASQLLNILDQSMKKHVQPIKNEASQTGYDQKKNQCTLVRISRLIQQNMMVLS